MQRGAIRSLFDGALKDIPFGAINTSQGLMFDGTQILGGAGDLTVDTNWYVSSTGDDTTGDGSQAKPWLTLARAWVERQKFDKVVGCTLTINLVGANIYTMPVLGASICGSGGLIIIQGDITAKTVSFTGTFTGNIAANVVGCSAGLGADTKRGQFVRIKTGALAGAELQIHTHTDTTITFMNSSAWGFGATANGDQFEVFVPTTQLTSSASASQPLAGPTDWIGGIAHPSLPANTPSHVFRLLRFSGNGFSAMRSAVTISTCRLGLTQVFGCSVFMGGIVNGFRYGVGTDAATNFLFGAGVYNDLSQMIVDGGSSVIGCLYMGIGTFTMGNNLAYNFLQPTGCRIDGTNNFRKGFLYIPGTAAGTFRFGRTLSIGQQALALFQNAVNFPVTAGDACLASDGGEVRFEVAPTGGTTAGAGFGCRTVGPSKIGWKAITPTLTGGTAGLDLKTDTNAAVPNATLNVNNTSLLDPITAGIIYRTA